MTMLLSELQNRRIAFTSPSPYSDFLQQYLKSARAEAIWVPTIAIQRSDRTRANIRTALTNHLSQVSGIAFTSRNGIRAIAEILPQVFSTLPPLSNPFYLAALGRDVELLSSLESFWKHPHRQVISPNIATPQALVQQLGNGKGQSILCPVPQVLQLREPDVVPNFLSSLEQFGWQPIRVDAYETIWRGPDCARLLLHQNNPEKAKTIDALIFTSTGEVEGLLKSFKSLGLDPLSKLKSMGMAIAAHGPVTAQGARAFGIDVQVVSQNSSSFTGVLQALQYYWAI